MFVRALSLYLVSSADARYLLFGLYKQRALSPVVWSGNLRCMISTRNAFSLLFFPRRKMCAKCPVFLPGQKIVVTAREMRRDDAE